MRPSLLRGLRVLAVSSFFAAAPLAAQGAAPAPAALPSVTLPPELDRVLRDYERAWRADDVAALTALFTEDGFVLQGGRPPARGRAAMTAVYTGEGGGLLRLRALAYAAGDTVGYIIGAYSYGDAPGDIGKFTLTLRRPRGGRWLIFSDMDNMNQPMRRPPTPAPAPSAPPGLER